MKFYAIREDLAQAIADFLADQPYRQTAHLINGITNLRELPEEQPVAPVVAEKTGS